jgi:WXXGXW repeat (2 copies)
MKNVRRTLILSLCLAGGAMLAPVVASAAVGIDITIAPPAPQVEVVPAPRAGFVWAPGFWEWRGNAHVWVPGRWIGARPGWRWVPDRWEQHGERWHHYAGHWER